MATPPVSEEDIELTLTTTISAWERRRRLPSSASGRWVLLCLIGLATLVLMSITTSSLGALDDPTDGSQGLVAGLARPIRSDEWIRVSPVTIGEATAGSTFRSQAAVAEPFQDADTPLARGALWLAFPEYAMGMAVSGISATVGFALTWWLPIALMWIFLPLWFREVGLSLRLGVLALVLLFFTPATAWWSYHPAQLLGWSAMAGFAALAVASRWLAGHRWQATGWLVVASVGLGHLALSYLVWAIPVTLTLLAPTAVVLLRCGRWRPGLAAIAACAIGGMGVAVVFVASSLDYYRSLAGTTFPAARAVAGDSVSPGLLLGGPFLAFTQKPGVEIVNSNLSEVSAGYTILGLLGVALVVAAVVRGRGPSGVTIAVGSWLALATAWCTATWPPIASHLFPLAVIPPARMAQILFVPSTVFFVLALATVHQLPPREVRLAAVLPWLLPAVALFMLFGGSQLRAGYIPALPIWFIWIISTAWVLALLVLLARGPRPWAMAPVVALAVASSIAVNPVQVGFADLQDSAAAGQLRELAADGGLAGADDLYSNAILAANALDSISGQQWGGPDSKAYLKLDPTQASRGVWNRGASSVLMQWTAPGTPLSFANPNPDLIVISADPCDPALAEVGLRTVVSNHPLSGHPCLVAAGKAQIVGAPKWLYTITS